MPIAFSLSKVTNNGSRIVRRIERRKRQLLDTFGRDGINELQALQRTAPGPSQPGQPPNVHSRPPNLETARHVVDMRNGGSARFGPIGFASRTMQSSVPLPRLIELGGVAQIRRRSKLNRRSAAKTYTARYRARPSVRPAAMSALRLMQYNVRRGGIA